ncbi:MAG TPA: glycosyl hydrolase family 79 C-terminal domain-containing protein, partial [Edaphobacter sp.]|nr:glycosyl hydrolase family 79 C-terminal domain-containing protein [Edaphobacter sp.]
MNRRKLLGYAATGVGAAVAERFLFPLRVSAMPDASVAVTVDEGRVLGSIPRDFIGLGYEISSVARPGLLSATNRVYAQMVKTLGAAGVIRVGGNTSDYAAYSEKGKAVSAPKATVVNRESLRELGTFLDATGWQLIWGLNLGQDRMSEAVAEAEAVSAAAKGRLLAFEIGNEVDLFTHEGHRKEPYAFEGYLGEYRRYKAAVRAKLPQAPFAGPDAAFRTEWVSRFAATEAHDLKLLTEHYYRGGQNPKSSLEMLFHPDPRLISTLETLQKLSREVKVPYRICETNSFSGGGRPGVSGTFGAALWVLDYMFTLASHDAAGVNIETGVNQLGVISVYSPIGDDEHGTYTAKPEYYGMLAFSRASKGNRVAAEAQAGDLNLSSYAVADGRQVTVTLINKDRERGAAVDLRCKGRIAKATAMRLVAPSLESSTGVTLGGAAVGGDGTWKAKQDEALRVVSGVARVAVPPGSAAIVV